MSDGSDVTGEYTSYDGEGHEIDTYTHEDGTSESFVTGSDGSSYEIDTDAAGNSSVEGVDGNGTYIEGDVDSNGHVTDAYAEDSQGNQVAMEDYNGDGTYSVQAEDAEGNYASGEYADPYLS